MIRSKMTMLESAATPIVRIRPGDPRQRQRDRDQLDQGEEEDRVDDQPEPGDHAEEAVVEDQEEEHDRRARRGRPSGPGRAPAGRASPRPSIWLISASSIGSAPIRSTSARSWASWVVKLPEICAPVRPSIPFGFSTKLMIGRDTSSPSSTIAKRAGELSTSARRRSSPRAEPVAAKQSSAPRWAISRVTVCERLAPLVGEVEGDVGLVGGRVRAGFGFSISSPESAGLSWRTKNCERPASDSSTSSVARVVVRRLARSRPSPAGPRSPCVFGGCSPPNGRKRSPRVLGGLAERLERVGVEQVVGVAVGRAALLLALLLGDRLAASRRPRPRRSAGCTAAPPGRRCPGSAG